MITPVVYSNADATSVKTIHVTSSFQNMYMICTLTCDVFETSAHVCNYYGIYMFKVHVHYIAHVTIYYGMYFIYQSI